MPMISQAQSPSSQSQGLQSKPHCFTALLRLPALPQLGAVLCLGARSGTEEVLLLQSRRRAVTALEGRTDPHPNNPAVEHRN